MRPSERAAASQTYTDSTSTKDFIRAHFGIDLIYGHIVERGLMTFGDDWDFRHRFSELKRLEERFEEDPSIENYVALRRFWLGGDTEIYRFPGVDPFQFLNQELKIARLDRSVVMGALSGDDRDIDELCLQLMERLIERRLLETQGETHLQARGKGISDALVNHLIISMMEALQEFSLEPKPSFVVLVRDRLGGANSDIYKSHKKWERQNRAIFLGMQMKRKGMQQTIRQIAEKMAVQPSTVTRWFPNGDFLEQVEAFERQFMKVRAEPSEPQ